MTTVFVIGRRTDNSIERLILSELTKTYRVIYLSKGGCFDSGKGYELVVTAAEKMKKIAVSGSVIVMKKDGIVPPELPKDATVIVNSENAEQLTALKSFGGAAVTCGNMPSDTLSYSSLSSDGMVISLNREIKALSGRIIQPLEIPHEISKRLRNIYSPIAFTAMRLLLDDFNSELGGLYR